MCETLIKVEVVPYAKNRSECAMSVPGDRVCHAGRNCICLRTEILGVDSSGVTPGKRICLLSEILGVRRWYNTMEK